MKTTNQWPRIAACIASATAITACATVKEGLVGEEQANVVPFAEQTVSALVVNRLDFRESEFAYLRALIGTDWPEVHQLRERLAVADSFRNDVIRYSIELVSIAESLSTDEEQVQRYVDMLAEIREQLPDEFDVSDAEFETGLAEIRTQDDLLAALRSAQPLIDASSEQFLGLINEIETVTLVAAIAELDRAIEDTYSQFIATSRRLAGRRDEMFRALELLNDIRLGDNAGIAELRAIQVLTNRGLSIPDSPTPAQIAGLEDFVLSEMQRDTRIDDYMAIDAETYLKIRAELDREEAEVLTDLNFARLQIVGWSRAHQAMANGANEPGKWLKVVMDASRAARSTR